MTIPHILALDFDGVLCDGRAESVYCGPGYDTVTADRFDRLHGCEQVKIVRG